MIGISPCHRGGTSKETLSVILSKIALVLFITLDCKLYPKFKKDSKSIM